MNRMSDILHAPLQGPRALVTRRDHLLRSPAPATPQSGRFRLKTAAAWARRALGGAAAPVVAQRDAYAQIVLSAPVRGSQRHGQPGPAPAPGTGGRPMASLCARVWP